MLKLAVRELAEFVHRRGDLHARLDGRTRADEGIAAQRALQQGRGDGYQRELPVRLDVELAGQPVEVSGRIDGCDASGDVVLVEEVKTTRADPALAHGHHASAHWAQARLYAGLLARELDDGRAFTLRLVYVHPDTLEAVTFEEAANAGEVLDFLAQTIEAYSGRLQRQRDHEALRDRHLAGLAFPFPQFRPYQRAMARRAYRALRDREPLLLEAPTGSGKTAATLYPAVRALEGAGYRRVLFLTSRTTGALAARDAAARMDADGAFLRHITLTAKERACFLPGTPCEPDACLYARGYHDRARDAVAALLERRAIAPDTVAETARAHTVCPFELSLDTASWCDVVVGDYNYVFDPVVRLKRFAGDPETALLVDESHQLAPRVAEMLSLAIERRAVRAALAEPQPEAAARRTRALDRALRALGKAGGGENDGEAVVEDHSRLHPLLRAMQRFTETLATLDQPLEALPATRELVFTCSRWVRGEAWYDPERFVLLVDAGRRDVSVRLACIDPGPYLRARLMEYGGHVRFSGTVSPLSLYARLHGVPDGAAERAGNPFSAEQLEVLVVDDVPTYLRRREAGLERLATLIHDVAAARAGHYLVAFPSFDYLGQAAEVFAARFPHTDLVCQSREMTDDARAGFLAGFAAGAAPRIGFVVLGGVFGESVDFSATRLAGVVCVGVGLPPPSLTRRAMARHFDRHALDGRVVAYQQPAMVKVLQMAGRLLRDPGDRGVLCLVDPRFRDPAYRQFFPEHWRPRTIRAAEAGEALANFWQGNGCSPRLRGLEQERSS
ncbi:MAG: helicase C-terminal domain-containing protein [Pseudomonadota bacterium]